MGLGRSRHFPRAHAACGLQVEHACMAFTWDGTSLYMESNKYELYTKENKFSSLEICHWDMPHVLSFIGFLIAMFTVVFGRLQGWCRVKNGIWEVRYLYLILCWLFLLIAATSNYLGRQALLSNCLYQLDLLGIVLIVNWCGRVHSTVCCTIPWPQIPVQYERERS